MVKIAYLILSHYNPDQVIRLARLLATEGTNSSVYIHHDQSRSYLDVTAFQRMPNIRLLDYVGKGRWGGFSLVEIMLRSLEKIVSQDDFDWFVLLSGQDYPAQPLAATEGELARTSYDGFISGVPVMGDQPCRKLNCAMIDSHGVGCLSCISRYYYPNPLFSDRLPLRVRKGCHWMLRKVASVHQRFAFWPLADMYHQMTIFKGSQWFTLNDRAISYVQNILRTHPGIMRHFRQTFIPDEAFFQTILFNNPEFRLSHDNRRLVNWNAMTYSASPEYFRTGDFDRIVASGAHFARKFDTSYDYQIVDLLDAYVTKSTTKTGLAQVPAAR